MNRHFIRSIALLLVASIMADSVTTSALSYSLSPGGRGRSPWATEVRGHAVAQTSFQEQALAEELLEADRSILNHPPYASRLLYDASTGFPILSETNPKGNVFKELERLAKRWEQMRKNGFIGPIIGDAVQHPLSPFWGMDAGQAPRLRRDGRYQISRIGEVMVYKGLPQGSNPRPGIVYLNTGGGVELFWTLRDRIHFVAARARVNALYWAPGEMAKNLFDKGLPLWHVTGADIDHPSKTHAVDIQQNAVLRVANVVQRMRQTYPGVHPLLLVGASVGTVQELCYLASGGQADGIISLNAAIQFATGAARVLALEKIPRWGVWGLNNYLPSLLPGTCESVLFIHDLQEGLHRVDSLKTPAIFISTIAPPHEERPASWLESVFSSRFATPGTDHVVNANYARGLGEDSKSLIPGSISIVVQGIEHFEAPVHPLIKARLIPDLTQMLARQEDIHEVNVEVNGNIVGKLGDFTPEHPLVLQARSQTDYDIVRFGTHYYSPGRLARQLWSDTEMLKNLPEPRPESTGDELGPNSETAKKPIIAKCDLNNGHSNDDGGELWQGPPRRYFAMPGGFGMRRDPFISNGFDPSGATPSGPSPTADSFRGVRVFPNPITSSGHLDSPNLSFLNRFHRQMKWLRENYLLGIYEHARQTGQKKIHILAIGASTGEELARLYYEVADWLETRDTLANWDIQIQGLEKEEFVVQEGRERLSGRHPFVDHPAEWEDLANHYGQDVVSFLNRHRDQARASMHLQKLDVMDFESLQKHLNVDIILMNNVLRYLTDHEQHALLEFLDKEAPRSLIAVHGLPLSQPHLSHQWFHYIDDLSFALPKVDIHPNINPVAHAWLDGVDAPDGYGRTFDGKFQREDHFLRNPVPPRSRTLIQKGGERSGGGSTWVAIDGRQKDLLVPRAWVSHWQLGKTPGIIQAVDWEENVLEVKVKGSLHRLPANSAGLRVRLPMEKVRNDKLAYLERFYHIHLDELSVRPSPKPAPDPSLFVLNLNSRMEANRWSSNDLSVVSGIPASAIIEISRGRRIPSAAMQSRLHAGLDKLEELKLEKDNPKTRHRLLDESLRPLVVKFLAVHLKVFKKSRIALAAKVVPEFIDWVLAGVARISVSHWRRLRLAIGHLQLKARPDWTDAELGLHSRISQAA